MRAPAAGVPLLLTVLTAGTLLNTNMPSGPVVNVVTPTFVDLARSALLVVIETTAPVTGLPLLSTMMPCTLPTGLLIDVVLPPEFETSSPQPARPKLRWQHHIN